MKLQIRLSNGDGISIKQFSAEDAMVVVEDFQTGDSTVMSFILDNSAVTHLARQHVVSVTIEDDSP